MMAKHHRNVQELVKTSENLTWDIILCEQDIQNIAKKLTKEKRIRNMTMMSKMFACGLEKTPNVLFYY
jgi:hypothetical protein